MLFVLIVSRWLCADRALTSATTLPRKARFLTCVCCEVWLFTLTNSGHSASGKGNLEFKAAAFRAVVPSRQFTFETLSTKVCTHKNPNQKNEFKKNVTK